MKHFAARHRPCGGEREKRHRRTFWRCDSQRRPNYRRGKNNVTTSNDPTAHAEVTAIRLACEALGDYQLNDCILYTSCEPCPMCLGAIYWARPKEVYFAAQHSDAASAGFDDSFIYEEITKTKSERKIPFIKWTFKQSLNLFSHGKRPIKSGILKSFLHQEAFLF